MTSSFEWNHEKNEKLEITFFLLYSFSLDQSTKSIDKYSCLRLQKQSETRLNYI